MDSNFQFLVASPSEGDGTQVSKMRADLSIAVGTPITGRHRVTGGGRPPPVPTERSVQISRTTLFRR